ncbi:MAG: hypothetical protein ACRYG4_19695, partial [Janthinobacterium lividum]
SDRSIDGSYNDSSSNSSISQNGAASTTAPGSSAVSNQFGGGAVVSTASLAGYVTGNTVNYALPGGAGGSGTSNGGGSSSDTPNGPANGGNGSTAGSVNNSLSVSGSAFQNFAGLQGLNMNTGIGASQNAAVNVSVSTGTMTIGGTR